MISAFGKTEDLRMVTAIFAETFEKTFNIPENRTYKPNVNSIMVHVAPV
jgi:hypothetical protein